MTFFIMFFLAMMMTMSLVPVLKGLATRIHALDFPDHRKIHSRPIPKIGGLAIATGTLLPVILLATVDQTGKSILIGAAVTALFGFADDIKNLSYKSKLAGQLIAALIVIFYGGLKIKSLGYLLPDGVLLPNWIAIPLTLTVIVGVTNAINLADGLDGLAAGISLLSLIFIGYLALHAGEFTCAILATAVAGSIIGFLRFNSYPAEIFMGDTGSQFLGFLTITLSLSLTQGNSPLCTLLPLIILGFPVLDTLHVILERIRKGNSPFKADNNHFHHRLVQAGFFHTEAVVFIYLIQIFLVICAFIFRFYSEWFLLVFYVCFSSIVLYFFHLVEKKAWKIKRASFVDIKVTGTLRTLKEKNIHIKISFWIAGIVTPSLFFATCLIPNKIPVPVGCLSFAMMLVIGAVWILRKDKLFKAVRRSIYILIPFACYFCMLNPSPGVTKAIWVFYNFSLALMVAFAILTLNFTRRKKGFKSTPVDFLILFTAIVVSNLPDAQIQGSSLGLLGIRIIIFYFCYEVLAGELRGEGEWLGIATLGSLSVLTLRSLT